MHVASGCIIIFLNCGIVFTKKSRLFDNLLCKIIINLNKKKLLKFVTKVKNIKLQHEHHQNRKSKKSIRTQLCT